MTYGSGQLAVQGILAALLARDKTGHGQHVQTSLLQVVTAHAMGQWAVPVGTEEEAAERFSAPAAGGQPAHPDAHRLPDRPMQGRALDSDGLHQREDLPFLHGAARARLPL